MNVVRGVRMGVEIDGAVRNYVDHTHGRFLAPTITVEADTTSTMSTMHFVGVVPEVTASYSVDFWILKSVCAVDASMFAERAARVADLVVWESWDLLWERATADWMVSG